MQVKGSGIMSSKNEIQDIKLNEECQHCINQKKFGGECVGKTILKNTCILFEKA